MPRNRDECLAPTDRVGERTNGPVGHSASAMPQTRPIPWLRGVIGGILMGLANLVPGVSGGTMILIIGLYDALISAIADVTRLRFTLHNVVLIGIVAGTAGLAIVLLAGPLRNLVVLQPTAMYALFIGMTLGGAPLLWRMMSPPKPASMLAVAVGFLILVGVAVSSTSHSRLTKEDKARIQELVRRGEFPIKSDIPLDLAAGVLGMSAMVLPGISGAYMLLLLGRYEAILGAVAAMKDYALSFGKEGDPTALAVIVPVAIGSLVSLVAVTNVLKWLLQHREKPTVGLLLGILLGSVITLVQRMEFAAGLDYALAGLLLPCGFVATIFLSRVGARGN